MKIKSDYFLEKNNDFYIIKPINKEITLNERGIFLWELMSEVSLSSGELLKHLLGNFEISTVLALGEIDSFIKLMKENGILE